MRFSGTTSLLGYHDPAGGWFVAGRIDMEPGLARGVPLGKMLGRIDNQENAQVFHFALLERNEASEMATGFLLFIGQPGGAINLPRSISLRFGQHEFRIDVAADATILAGTALVRQFHLLLDAVASEQAVDLAAILRMELFTGVSSVEAVKDAVQVGIDELAVLPDGSTMLFGWLLAEVGIVRSLRFCWGRTQVTLKEELLISIDRPDVVERIGHGLGLNDVHCGFGINLPRIQPTSDAPYLIIETRDRQIAYIAITPRHLRGLSGIKRLLEMFEIESLGVAKALDALLGSAVRCLNRQRLAEPAACSVLTFGDLPAAPRCSLLIPLYGRVDFMECQIGLLSAEDAARTWDIIYVLDDPRRRREASELARSVHARFGVPFRLVLLAENRGYAVASNVALGLARGEFVCFLNSDVIPGTGRFPDRLAATLEANPDLGAVGPLLLFEDGSVQHEGMSLQPLPELGGLRFPIHLRKGRRPRRDAGVERCELITGACLVMRRSLALEIGGFDEDYVLGDFEDCDLCSRLQARGRPVAVDHTVQLYHLERQSQASPDATWRRNLTLYNAWVFNGRYEGVATAASVG